MLQFRKMVWLKNTAKMPGARRAASALLFCAAALALALFPEGAAGGAVPGAAPAQIDQEIRVTDYADPEFCRQRGGTVETDGNNQEVCSDVDANDTFCIIGSADAFPCQGLLKHVARCNDDYRRPALNPFFCGVRCEKQIPDSPFPVLARGKKCEQHVTVAGVVLSTLAATIYAPEGFASAAATVEALEGYTLNFSPHPPLEATFAVSLSSGDYVIQTLPPGLRAPATLQLTAEIACATCIREVSLTLAAVFIPVVAPPQSVFAMTPDVALSARVTFSLPLLESYPGLSNPAFVDADGGDEFDIDANGEVSGTPARDTLATRVLRGYWTADGMLGTLVLTLTLEENSRASEMLDAALPVSARVISATAAFGYAGPVGRIVSRTTTEASLLFSPETKDGLSLAADGGVYPEIPLDGALGTEFGVVITLLAGARIRRVSVGVDVEPVFPPEQDFVIMEVGNGALRRDFQSSGPGKLSRPFQHAICGRGRDGRLDHQRGRRSGGNFVLHPQHGDHSGLVDGGRNAGDAGGGYDPAGRRDHHCGRGHSQPDADPESGARIPLYRRDAVWFCGFWFCDGNDGLAGLQTERPAIAGVSVAGG